MCAGPGWAARCDRFFSPVLPCGFSIALLVAYPIQIVNSFDNILMVSQTDSIGMEAHSCLPSARER